MEQIKIKKDRVGIQEEQKFAFPDGEPIWIMTNRLDEKESVESALNRQVILIKNIDDLLVEAQNSVRNGNPHASLVVLPVLPTELESVLSAIVTALNTTMPDVKVYEIGRDPLFEHGISLGSINQFKILSKNGIRKNYITEYDTTDDKQAEILKSLQEDLDLSKLEMAEKEQEKAVLESEKQELAEGLKELSIYIEEKYVPELETYKVKSTELEADLKESNIALSLERKKGVSYRREANELREKIVDFEVEVSALERKIAGCNEAIDKLKLELSYKEDRINDLVLEKHQLAKTLVEEEQLLLLQKELDNLQQDKDDLLKDVVELRVLNKTAQMNIEDLEVSISAIRQGTAVEKTFGRSPLLDRVNLKTSDLVYIKVIDNLPYHKLAIRLLFQIISRKYYSDKGVMFLIKNDDGIDNLLYPEINYLSKVSELDFDEQIVRLRPSTVMFSGMESVEKDRQVIFIVDYIQNNDYLVTTNARSHVMTMVDKSTKIHDIEGLQGTPLSLDSQSIFPLKYDAQIGSMTIRKNRHEYLIHKVGEWANKLQIIN